MTEITEGNKLIAEFMGFGPPKKQIGDKTYYVGSSDGEPTYGYNNSWDWLMPVVEKIRNFKDGIYDMEGFTFGGMSVHISSRYSRGWTCHIFGTLSVLHINSDKTHSYSKLPDYSVSIDSNKNSEFIEPIWQAVIQFIKWYNQNK